MLNLKKKVLFGLSISLVLAMAIGSLALGEAQTLATQRVVRDPEPVERGAFVIYGGTEGTDASGDWDFSGTSETDGVLKIHPQSSSTEIKIKNKDPEVITTDRIEVAPAEGGNIAGTVNITLAGVNIVGSGLSSPTLTAFKIEDNATFNVNIFLADDTINTLKSSTGAGLQKSGEGDGIGKLTIGVPSEDGAKGNGKLTVTGGRYSAGIGGGQGQAGSNIRITGGIVTATAGAISLRGVGGAGIGGGGTNSSSGTGGNGNGIVITGGVVKATGNSKAAGIGGGEKSTGSQGNKLDGDAVVLVTSGDPNVVALDGFDSTAGLVRGIAFTRQGTSSTSWIAIMYGDSVKITGDVEFPDDFAVGSGRKVTIGNGVTLTAAADAYVGVSNSGMIINEGTINIPGDHLVCTGNGGQITTLLKYDPQGGSFDDLTDSYQLYQDSSGAGKSYTNLPTPTTNAIFNGWKRNADGTGAKLSESTVDLNLHQAYADMNYTVTFDSQGGSDVAGTTSKYKGKVTAPTTPPTREGYTFDGWYKDEGCTTLWDFDKDTVQGDTTLYAGWTEDPTPTPPTPTPPGPEPTPTPPGPEPGPEPTPTPEPAPDPSVNPDGGDGSGSSSKTSDPFMGGMALALLGVATTGAVLVRKRK